MREITKVIKIYRYDELEGDARAKAFDFMKEGYEDAERDEFVWNMEKAADKLGFEVEYDLNEYYSHVYIFYGKYDNDLNEINGARAYAFIQNNFFSRVDKRRYIRDGHYTHLPDKNWMDKGKLSGYYTDYAIKEAWEQFVKELRKGNKPSVSDFIGYIEDAFVKMYQDEIQGYDDEMAEEEADGNNFEFTEDGGVYYGGVLCLK